MKICILGWYGTETLGDRAILDGIFKIFDGAYSKYSVYLGSLFPFFTKRTLLEDGKIYTNTSKNMKLMLFDERDKNALKKHVKMSDLVVMGGGPIMDIDELKIIRDGFFLAKKNGKKTMLMGCGVGPLNKTYYKKIVKDILKKTDVAIFRDEESYLLANSIYEGTNFKVSADPAIFSVLSYKMKNSVERKKYVAINLREYPSTEYGKSSSLSDFELVKILQYLGDRFEEVLLVPMHTFKIGGDDRYFLSKLIFGLSNTNIKVLHSPLNLYDLYGIYMNSHACIGMRYHSILMQTILNGNNYILDYTQKEKGKISAFLKYIDNSNFYSNRYYNMQMDNTFNMEKLNILENQERFHINEKYFDELFNEYISDLKNCC